MDGAKCSEECSDDRRKRLYRANLLIGETGFEPATARPPAGCATRLRHSPRLPPILRRALNGSTVTLDGARDNWFGPWPPAGLADESGEVPTEERR